MKKLTLIVVIVIICLGALYFVNRKTAIAPTVPLPVTADSKPIELCFYKKEKTSRGLFDVNWLKMSLLGDKVTGEFRYLPAEKDKKVGTFEGTVGAVDKAMMARVANVWWNSEAEGMQVKEQLRIVFGEGTAQAGFGEMVDKGDGTYVYKDVSKITYGVSMTDVACADLDSLNNN